MPSVYLSLLTQWCDALLAHQLHGMNDAHFDGALICPSCKYLHGRSHDAVYPLLYLADRTGNQKYMEAAKQLFDWHDKNMMCDDGSAYNDPNSMWNGITVFAAVALCEALEHHGHLLDAATRLKWEDKLRRMAAWLYEALTPTMRTNINYHATNAAAMAFTGRYLNNATYTAQADVLAQYALDRFTENGLLYGEGKPIDKITPRGCRPVDIGYNVEESLPALVKYARVRKDEALVKRLCIILRKQLAFMLPDGAWDNSFGSRNNKWTYYGSRTSDGCQGAYALLAAHDPAFAEASLRNTELMMRCSQGGLLHGGPEYYEHGEPPCIHHTFTHANAITAALDAGIEQYTQRAALPTDADAAAIQHFPEIDTYKLTQGPWRATVTAYDHALDAGHASGGTLSLLWHRAMGPVIASSVVDYRLVETLNMQLSQKKARHQPLTPRMELYHEDVRYAQCYDQQAVIEVQQQSNALCVTVHASLVALTQEPLPSPVRCRLVYTITQNAVTIEGNVYGGQGAAFILPVIAKDAVVKTEPACTPPEDIFFLTGGFGAKQYTIQPDGDGCIFAQISASTKFVD